MTVPKLHVFIRRMMRVHKHLWFLKLAAVVAEQATCARRSVGCVLTNNLGHILATGYNGRPNGFEHCNEGHECSGACLPSGQGLDLCEAVHAEQNALLQCRDVGQIETCYVTCSPCLTCVKLLLNTGCRRIIFSERYAHDETAQELWMRNVTGQQRAWVHCLPPNR